jgi:hypothetical protein
MEGCILCLPETAWYWGKELRTLLLLSYLFRLLYQLHLSHRENEANNTFPVGLVYGCHEVVSVKVSGYKGHSVNVGVYILSDFVAQAP